MATTSSVTDVVRNELAEASEAERQRVEAHALQTDDPRYGARAVRALLTFCGAVSVMTTAGIIGVLGVEAYRFFSAVGFEAFFGETRWTPLAHGEYQHFGVWPLVSGTLLTSVIACAVAVPLGLLAAIYLSEFASRRVRKVFKPALEILAGVPTVVYGYFALTLVTPALGLVIPGLSGPNALSPGIVMGIMIIPMVSSLSEDALHAVPDSLREGAYGLGASKFTTIVKVVLPSAKSGIIAATTLAVARAIGETMIVTVAAGSQANLTFNPTASIQTMTSYIAQKSIGEIEVGTVTYQTIFAVGATLFVMTFAMNAIGQYYRRRDA